ncbi:MAG: CHAT domain-containing protein [Caldilineaceae bacterium]
MDSAKLIAVMAGILLAAGCAQIRVNSVEAQFQQIQYRGEQAYQRGDYQQAEAYWQRGLLAARKRKSDTAAASFLIDLARLDEGLGRYQQSVSHADEAATIAQGLGDSALEARALDALGLGYRRLADYAKALASAERALEIARRIPDQRLQASALRNIGSARQALGDYDAAASAYESSVTIAESIGDAAEQAKSLNNLGGLYRLRGDYQRALDYYARSLERRRQLHDQAGEGRVLGNICLAYQNLGDYTQALDYCQQSLDIARGLGDRVREANNLNNVGAIYRAAGKYDQALDNYRQSVELKQGFGDLAGVGRGLANIAEIYWRLRQYDQAVAYSERSLETSQAIGDRSGESVTEVNLGSLYLDQHRYPDATEHFQRALVLQVELGQPEVLWRIFDGMSRTESLLNHPDLAILYGKQAVNTIQAMRASISDLEEQLQRFFLRDKMLAYRNVANLLIDEGRLPEAQQVLDMLKEEEYFDFIRRQATDNPRKTLASSTKTEEEWNRRYREIVEIGKEYSAIEAKGEAVTEQERARHAEIAADLTNARKEFQTAVKELIDVYKKDRSIGNLRAIQTPLRNLGHGVVLVHYFVTPDKLRLMVTGPNPSIPPVQRDDAITDRALRELIQNFKDKLIHPASDPEPEAQALYSHLISPIEADLQAYGAHTLMVYLDDALRYIPLAALHDGRQYLVQRYALVTYSPVANLQLQTQPVPNWRAVGLGVSQAVDNFPALAAVRDELDAIIKTGESDPRGILPGEEYLDAEFTAAELETALKKSYPVIHLASHFKLDPGTNEDSYLVIGGGAHLTLADLSLGDYSAGSVDLLTLSACETAVGRTSSNGSEVEEGLAALTQSLGARSVLATLWSVSDRSTAKFMEKFYSQRTARHRTKADALQEAQRAFLSGSVAAEGPASDRGTVILGQPRGPSGSSGSYQHPYYWAPFILMGNWL